MKSRSTPVRRTAMLALAPLIVAAAACADALPPAPTQNAGSLRASLTPEVFALLNERGEFPEEALVGASHVGLSAHQAKSLAVAFWTTHEKFVRPYAERDRGAPIAASGLKACPRAHLAESAYEPAGADIPEQIRRSLGDQWLVGLCAGNEQQVAIAVSVSATNVTVEQGRLGPLMRGARSGDFKVMGVRAGAEVPLPPERTVLGAAAMTGRRVASAPRLVRRPMPKSAFTSVWSIGLPTSAYGVRRRRTQSGPESWCSDHSAAGATSRAASLRPGPMPSVTRSSFLSAVIPRECALLTSLFAAVHQLASIPSPWKTNHAQSPFLRPRRAPAFCRGCCAFDRCVRWWRWQDKPVLVRRTAITGMERSGPQFSDARRPPVLSAHAHPATDGERVRAG